MKSFFAGRGPPRSGPEFANAFGVTICERVRGSFLGPPSFRNSEGVASGFPIPRLRHEAIATLSELRGISGAFLEPGLQQPWAAIRERFQR